MRSQYAKLHDQLGNALFKQPLYLNSSEEDGALTGDVYALLDYPFGTVRKELTNADHWCDVLSLHINVKRCQIVDETPPTIMLNIGKKYDQPAGGASTLDFKYRVLSNRPDFMQLALHADKGPYSTSNHRITVEAIPMEGKTWIHFAYSHSYGTLAKVALSAYLNTMARNKVGFTLVDQGTEGQPQYIKGVRGMIERNVMRYYLALDAYLGSLAAPPSEQFEKRIHNWFAATERYPRQLHEVAQNEYIEMKRKEFRNQQSPALANSDR